jgi:Na(+)-translocating NADH:ubiquinone oxidoreductase F subunit
VETILEPQEEKKCDETVFDYSLVGANAKRAIEKGLAEADWYQSPVPRETMRELLKRRNGPGIRDTLIWFGLLGLSGTLGVMLWGSWWAILPFSAYGVLYASSSDSRWHESSHGTVFKTDWMNNVLYEIASFMVMRESTLWRWSHTRHHSDTIVVGRDPEIAAPRPVNLKTFILVFFGIPQIKAYFQKLLKHSTGRLFPDEATFIPESEHAKVFFKARVSLLIYVAVVGSCFYFGTILPLLFIGLPNLYGTWLMPIYGYTQHVGLAENVLDHRMNCRTVKMNLINRYLYWNMNYHIEHHMFPLVPYHNLPRLHEILKDDMPKPYTSIWDAWREIIPAVRRQAKDPTYFVEREMPTLSDRTAEQEASKTIVSSGVADGEGWIAVGAENLLEVEDVLRFDYAEHTYAVYRTAEGEIHATDGICTHGNTHLATGLVKGCQIECSKHNGRFDVRDGSPQRAPVCAGLRTHPVRVDGGKIFINVISAGGEGAKLDEATYTFQVVRNDNVASFIKELVLEPADGSSIPSYKPGQYLQIDIPAYGEIPFSSLQVNSPYDKLWLDQKTQGFKAENHTEVRRNYSMASNPELQGQLTFNVRISTPPVGHDCSAGIGSSYVWNLKPGDTVTAIGPFGDFFVKETEKEMVYLGGGAGMAPLRAHLSHLFETLKTGRKISYWYGARSLQEMFYQGYFEELARTFENFSFHPALSDPLPDDEWAGHTGFIHEVLRKEYLDNHPDPASVEYYLCGPQPMIMGARHMLEELGVAPVQIAYDEF